MMNLLDVACLRPWWQGVGANYWTFTQLHDTAGDDTWVMTSHIAARNQDLGLWRESRLLATSRTKTVALRWNLLFVADAKVWELVRAALAIGAPLSLMANDECHEGRMMTIHIIYG